jgi:hypothetical protein
MQALRVLVVVMGVMIVGGTITLGVLVWRKLGSVGAPVVAASVLLEEPEGTRIMQASAAGETVVLRLEGGGPDRVVVVDTRTGRVVGRVGLAR